MVQGGVRALEPFAVNPSGLWVSVQEKLAGSRGDIVSLDACGRSGSDPERPGGGRRSPDPSLAHSLWLVWGPAPPSKPWVSTPQGSRLWIHSPSVLLNPRCSGGISVYIVIFLTGTHCREKGPLLINGGNCFSPGSSFDESLIYCK